MNNNPLSIVAVGALGLALLGASPAEPERSGYAICQVPFTAVEIQDPFWTPRLEINRAVTIPYIIRKFHESGQVSANAIEAALLSLAKHPDASLAALIEPDLLRLEEKLRNPVLGRRLVDLGEGLMYDLAATHARTTGSRTLLDTALRHAHASMELLGPEKRRDVPEHQGIELGLAHLSEATGDPGYSRFAKFLLDERGRDRTFYGRRMHGLYAQDHLPVADQEEAVGHAVRATFMYASMTDVEAVLGDPSYRRALNFIWEDAFNRKMHLTGGLGSRRRFEGFGGPYELPNVICWCETCAAFGGVLWNHRMFRLTGEGKYLDILERTLYNGLLSGVSLEGDMFFYQNPLRALGGFERSEWFGVPCCPPNLARLLASLGDYIYAHDGEGLFVNLYIGGRAEVDYRGGRVRLEQESRYPWEGEVSIRVTPAARRAFALRVRIPGWAEGRPVPGDLYTYIDPGAEPVAIKVNGARVAARPEKGFVRIDREWTPGDVVTLSFPMPVRRVLAHPMVMENAGSVALERGPLVYCAEGIDNNGHVHDLLVPDQAVFQTVARPDLLGGILALAGEVKVLRRGRTGAVERLAHRLTAVPYFSWSNRAPSDMSVWLARDESRVRTGPVPGLASGSRVTVPPSRESAAPGIGNTTAVNDGAPVIGSFDDSFGFLRLIPLEGDLTWVQYDLPRPARVSEAEVFWFEDRRFSILPASWRILYRDGNGWTPVDAAGPYPVERDTFCKVRFAPVETTALRLEVRAARAVYFPGEIGPPTGDHLNDPVEWFECGLLEWRIK